MLLDITAELRIASTEFEFSYVRSSGPGGQNVNKVNSKAVLRWNLFSSMSVSPEMMVRLASRLKSKITVQGDVIISSDRYRDQIRNRDDCVEKFRSLMMAASFRPKLRKKTKPSYSSKRKGIAAKEQHSVKKALRRSPKDFD